ncbi:MAG: insulinase family protein [Clostridia bacterium]|nr:insulinase family protein [Clostridia bacterium]
MIIRDYSERIKLCLIDDRSFKSNFFAVNVIIPLDKSNVTESVLLPNVMIRGTKSCPDIEALSRKLSLLYGASLYADAVKKNDNLVLSFSVRFVKDRFSLNGEKIAADAVGLLFEMLSSPCFESNVFKSEYTESELKNLRDRIDAEINDKRRYVLKSLIANLCKDEPFGISANGYKEDLERITPETLTKRYREIMANSKIFAFFFGECDENVICEGLFSAFDKQSPFSEAVSEAKTPCGEPQFIREEMAITQAKLAIGFKAGSLEGYTPAETGLFNAVYGSGATSKLFENVREKLSLCYYCASRVYRQKGIMTVDSGVEIEKYETAYNEILSQLDDVANKRITEREFVSAKNAMRNAYNSLKDSFFALHDWYLSCFIAGDIYTPDEITELIDVAEADRIAEIASLFKPQTVYLLSPKK